jgi:hypothetical protein
MEFVWLLIFFFVGLMVASFTIIPVLIILFFGIPLTNKLEKRGLLHKNGIKKGYMLNLIIFPLIYLGQVGTNKNNVSDYFETNKRHFTASQEEVLQAVLTR